MRKVFLFLSRHSHPQDPMLLHSSRPASTLLLPPRQSEGGINLLNGKAGADFPTLRMYGRSRYYRDCKADAETTRAGRLQPAAELPRSACSLAAGHSRTIPLEKARMAGIMAENWKASISGSSKDVAGFGPC